MPTPWVVIVNPAAGNGRAGRQWLALSRQLAAAGRKHVALLTRQPGEATRLCETALRGDTRVVIAAGGDGTINEVINGFFEPGDGNTLISPDARFGVLPLGTGSDFGRTFGIGYGARALETLLNGTDAHIDVGRVDLQSPEGRMHKRYFVNVADLGLGAETAYRINRSPKRLGAFLGYLFGAIRSIAAHQPPHISIDLDGSERVEERMGIVVVANNRFFGGGMRVVPHAQPDDGLFDVFWLKGTGRLRLLVDLLPKLYRGAHLRHPLVRQRRVRCLTVDSKERLLLEVDGEQIGTAPAHFTIVPQALPIFVPQAWVSAVDSTGRA